MALFGSGRDASLIRSMSRELLRYIDTEVLHYKLVLDSTNENIYGESERRTYYSPTRITAIVQKDEKVAAADDFGLEFNRTGVFAFLRDDLKDTNIHIEEGDVIFWDNEYYEIDNVGSSQYWAGRNPTTLLGNTSGELDEEFGYSVAIVAEAHVTKRNSINIEEVRSGVNKPAYISPMDRGIYN